MYTYGHTLSLRVALPIFSVRCAGALCRGSAGGQPDQLRGGRSAISAAYRNKGGMRMEALERELVGLAFCWRLDRRDGVSMGLTSHDRDLMVDGLIYRASPRSEEHTSELQSLMRSSYAVFCLKKKTKTQRSKTQR